MGKDQQEPDAATIDRCSKLERHLASNRIDMQEYFYNFTLALVLQNSVTIQSCVNNQSMILSTDYMEYIDCLLKKGEYTPFASPHCIGGPDSPEIAHLATIVADSLNQIQIYMNRKFNCDPASEIAGSKGDDETGPRRNA